MLFGLALEVQLVEQLTPDPQVRGFESRWHPKKQKIFFFFSEKNQVYLSRNHLVKKTFKDRNLLMFVISKSACFLARISCLV
jgi:hypothetical protein